MTRRIVAGELQAITYHEFLPALLGSIALRSYSGYDADANSGIATEFSTAAYRIGHTLVNDDVEFLDNDGNPMRDELDLVDASSIRPRSRKLDPIRFSSISPPTMRRRWIRNSSAAFVIFYFGPPAPADLILLAQYSARTRSRARGL